MSAEGSTARGSAGLIPCFPPGSFPIFCRGQSSALGIRFKLDLVLSWRDIEFSPSDEERAEGWTL